jgi:hypothetical protein
MVQADLALGLLEAFLNRPAGPGHPDQPDEGGAGRAGAGVEGHLAVAAAAAPINSAPEPTHARRS